VEANGLKGFPVAMMLSSPGPAPAASHLVEREESDVVERIQLPVSRIQAEDNNMAELVAYWRALRPDGLLPSRKLLDPVAMKAGFSAASTSSTPARRVPEGFFFRLWAARSASIAARTTARCSSANYPRSSWRRAVMQDYADVVQSGVPAYHLVKCAARLRLLSIRPADLPLAETAAPSTSSSSTSTSAAGQRLAAFAA